MEGGGAEMGAEADEGADGHGVREHPVDDDQQQRERRQPAGRERGKEQIETDNWGEMMGMKGIGPIKEVMDLVERAKNTFEQFKEEIKGADQTKITYASLENGRKKAEVDFFGRQKLMEVIGEALMAKGGWGRNPEPQKWRKLQREHRWWGN